MTPPLVVIPTPRSRWSGGTVFGLGDPVAEARILDRTLADWRRPTGPPRLTGGAPAPLEGPALVLGEDLWLSPGTAAAFDAAAAALAAPVVRLGRRPDGPGAIADPLGRLPRGEDGTILMDLWRVAAGTAIADLPAEGPLPPELTQAPTVDLGGRTHRQEMPIDPEIGGGEVLELEVGAWTAAPVGHWVELLRANLLAIGAEVLSTPVWRGALSLFWAILRAASLNPFKILGKLTRRGRRCVVHPTAVVEGCQLGDGVKVDAGAVLRGCVIGDGAEIGAQAIAEMSVIGAGATLQRRAMAKMCVLYPGSRTGGILQLGLVGREAVTKMFGVGTDMRLGAPVSVKVPGGRLAEVDIRYQGVCLGHGAFVGSGVWIAPGRVIEAGRQVVREAELMVLK